MVKAAKLMHEGLGYMNETGDIFHQAISQARQAGKNDETSKRLSAQVAAYTAVIDQAQSSAEELKAQTQELSDLVKAVYALMENAVMLDEKLSEIRNGLSR
jgi:hypothetical protein